MSQIEVNVDELKAAIASFQIELGNYKSVAENYKSTVGKFSDMNSNFCNEMKQVLEEIQTNSVDDIVLEIENYIKTIQSTVDEFNRVDEEGAESIKGGVEQGAVTSYLAH